MHCKTCGKWTMEVYANLLDDGRVLLICLDCFAETVRAKRRLRALDRYARRHHLD